MPWHPRLLYLSRTQPSNPVGGSSALRVYERQKDPNWRKGATGEYLMDQFLHRTLSDGEVILTDRRVPGTDANIDNVVVAPSGVWIIDSKKWNGKIEYKASTLTGIDMHLFVGGEDRTLRSRRSTRLVIPVAQLVDDRSVPINPALVFIEGDWKLSVTARHLLKKPYKHEGVWISPPRLLAKLIKEPGPLDDGGGHEGGPSTRFSSETKMTLPSIGRSRDLTPPINSSGQAKSGR